MGVDYSAEFILTVPVVLDDFVETKSDFREVCAHAQAEGAKFCPVCGTKASERVRHEMREVVRPGIPTEFIYEDEGEDDEDGPPVPPGHALGWFERQARLGFVRFGDVRLDDLNCNPKHPEWVLRMTVGASGSSRTGGGRSSVTEAVLGTMVASFKERIAKLGIRGREVSVCSNLTSY